VTEEHSQSVASLNAVLINVIIASGLKNDLSHDREQLLNDDAESQVRHLFSLPRLISLARLVRWRRADYGGLDCGSQAQLPIYPKQRYV
jgi:hypothetical protein